MATRAGTNKAAKTTGPTAAAAKPDSRASARKATTKATATKTTVPKPARAKPAAGAGKPAKAKSGDGPKTRPGAAPVAGFIAALDDPQQRADSQVLVQMMRAATACEPVMWGGSIVGFDRYHYRYDSGHEGDMALIGFSPRKGQMVLYLMPGFAGSEALLARLGRHRIGKSCLYIRRLADVDAGVLAEIVHGAVAEMRRRYPR